MYDLNKLAQHRKDILLAEVVGWLHDMGKCADAFLQKDGTGFKSRCEGTPQINPHKAVLPVQALENLPYWSKLNPKRGQCARKEEADHLTALWRTLEKLHLTIPNYSVQIQSSGSSIQELILWGRPLVADRYQEFKKIFGNNYLAHLSAALGRAHKVAHMEKEDTKNHSSLYIDTPFGYKVCKIENLDKKLEEVLRPDVDLGKLKAFRQRLSKNFRQAPGDTRLPINEVTLWDWSFIVAALFKAEVARFVLTGQEREPEQMAWRLLSIRTDGLTFLFSVSSIPDLLVRQSLLNQALERVKHFLEEEYPIGLEVYRDENGSVFVVPDLNDLLEKAIDGEDSSLHSLILQQFASSVAKDKEEHPLHGELIPELNLDGLAWQGEVNLPPIGKGHLQKNVALQSDYGWTIKQWQGRIQDVCTVCGIRPQGPGKKSVERNVCNTCEERRANRAEMWAKSLAKDTIWIDEVADRHGRLALITGCFGLKHWLSGDLVTTLRLTPDTPKTPSFARLRRIWETTQRFWQELSEQIQGEYQSQRIRLQITGGFIPDDGKTLLPRYHSYVLVKDQLKMSVLWDGSAFLSCDNLEYLSSKEQLGQPVEEFLAKTKDLTVYTPSEYGTGSQQIGTLQNIQIAEKGRYSPVIPILTEPNAFMMLVPAEKVLDVGEKIKAKYEEEMGKVRNRLPVHIGAVFAHRRTPLHAILDAGRAMLRQPSDAQVWKVEGKVTRQSNGQGQSAEVAEVYLKQQNRTLCWRVPLRMGDGTTEDQWYPYAFSKTGAANRQRSAKACNPWTGQEDCLVHASELKAGDEIYFTPATFDFEFLDTNARRFEIHYNGEGRRPSRPTRPLYLDELTEVKQIWECLKELSQRQRRQIIHSIEATRQLWYGHEQPVEDETFRQFVADTLANAEWPQKACWKNLPASEKEGSPASKKENSPGLTKESFIQAGCSGLLADVGELYMEILKA